MSISSKVHIREIAKKVIVKELETIRNIDHSIDQNFENAIDAILNSRGRIVVTGIGKSAIIANKLVATFNSTGTPALFMHAADAVHGDLGMILPDDIVLVLSKSGSSPEIKVLIPILKAKNHTIIAITSNAESFLAKQAHISLYVEVREEACPHNLAPTSSTTAQLVLGDALAITLQEIKGFSSQDFAEIHPGGALGKQLYLKVDDLVVLHEKPSIGVNASLKEVVVELTSKRLGIVVVTNDRDQIQGIITDRDLRIALEQELAFDRLRAEDFMNTSPITINSGALAVDALSIIKRKEISQLVVIDVNKNYRGIVHIHDLIQEGII